MIMYSEQPDPCNIGEGDLCLKEGVEGQLRLLELLLLLPDPALLHLHHATHTQIPASRVISKRWL